MTHQGKDWIDIHEIESQAVTSGDTVAVSNIRRVNYYNNEEFDNYSFEFSNKTYDLNELKRVWFFENNYGRLQSHIMLSFEFEHDVFLTVSVEVRKRNLKDFEVWHVFVKDFNIFYILSVEEDIIFLRTNIRKSPSYLYELDLTQQQQRALLLEVCASVNKTYKNNNIYKVFRTDCVSTLLSNFRAVGIPVKKYFWDWSPTRVLFRSGLIKGGYKTLAEVYEKTYINSRTEHAKQDITYSRIIRSRT
ncbi:MAG: DUF4105 domain-containing protein [Minisyncoccia bacterium]